MKGLEDILNEHSFFKGLKQEYLSFIVGCASNVHFKEGDIILREGEKADKFYLIRHGKVAIDIPITQHRSITIQTIRDGEILGWSWLIPPHRYRFNARAAEDTRVTALDGRCLRDKCEKNHDLGYELLKRLTGIFTQRLEVTRMQLINMYDVDIRRNNPSGRS